MEPINFTVGNDDANCYTFDMRKLEIAKNIHKDHIRAMYFNKKSLFLEWTLIMHQLEKNLFLDLMIKLLGFSLLIKERAGRFIMGKECKSKIN